MKTKLPLFIIWLSVSAACSSPVSRNIQDMRSEPQAEAGSSDAIPYPVPTLQDRLDYLEGKIVRLSNEVETLNGKVKALEHAKTHSSGRTPVQKLDDRKLKEHYLNTEGGSASAHTVETAQNLYNQALKHYQNGRFSAAAALLKGADGGDGGSIAATQYVPVAAKQGAYGELRIRHRNRRALRQPFQRQPNRARSHVQNRRMPIQASAKRHCKGDLAQPDTGLPGQPGGKTRRRCRTQTIVFSVFPLFTPSPPRRDL